MYQFDLGLVIERVRIAWTTRAPHRIAPLSPASWAGRTKRNQRLGSDWSILSLTKKGIIRPLYIDAMDS
jgi:hypothetical protein